MLGEEPASRDQFSEAIAKAISAAPSTIQPTRFNTLRIRPTLLIASLRLV
jgi:hypothetical protein